LFGLIFTPVFYVVMRRMANWLRGHRHGHAVPRSAE